MPTTKPMAAGHTAMAPLPAFISMAGIRSDHTDAATITPEANPNSDFCNSGDISSFIRKTNDELNMVPNRGIRRPIRMDIIVGIRS